MSAAKPASGALNGVFASGSPPLMETLRTLVVSPRRVVTPGELIRVEFAFSNLGGAAATGVRVRFASPSGATYVEGSDTVDDAPLTDEVLVATTGAALGDLAPNGQRRVACSFRVNERVEQGTELLFQAALSTDQTAVVASNAERLVVRSEPQLRNSATLATIAAPSRPKPGDVITVRTSIANTGSSSAHDVRAFLPVPPHTRFVPRSARIAGRALGDASEEPFDYGGEPVVAERLAPGQSVEVEYQAAIDSPLPDGTRVRVSGAIASREIPEFPVQSAEIVIASPPEFINEETGLTVFCDDIVSPGMRVPVNVRALNSGTGDAHNVSISIDLPGGIAYTPGSAQIDGQPVADEAFAGSTFSLGTVPAGRAVETGIAGVAVLRDEPELPITATLRWKAPTSAHPGAASERRFTRMLRVRAASRFTRERNFIEIDRAVVHAREDVTFAVHVFNDGTSPESDVHLRVIPGAFLEEIRIAESADEPVPYSEPFVLGIVQPHAERTFTIRGRVASPVPDRAHVTLGAVLEFASGTFDLGIATLVVRSRPHVAPESCSWIRQQSDAMRPGHSHELAIRFTNDGADVLPDARLELTLPPELVLDRAQNARREGRTLVFGDVPAETTHEARVVVRLSRPARRDRVLTVEGALFGHGISAVRFTPLEIPTFAQPEFAQDAQLRSNPAATIKAGERIWYEIQLRNTGDGPAEHLLLRSVPSNLTVYVPGSTQLNGVTIPDDLGTSQLWSQRGLALTDVNPDVALRVRWEMLVIAPIAAGTAIDARAVVEWDNDRSIALAAPPLRVLSAPSLEAGAGGTPISLAHLAPAIEAPPSEAIVPIAPEIGEPEPVDSIGSESAYLDAVIVRSEEPAATLASGPTLYADRTPEQVAHAIRALEKSDAGGLLPHLFAIAALYPNALAQADTATAQLLESSARAFRAPLDRFFVRLHAPRLSVTAKDLEDRDSRFALRAAATAALDASPAHPEERPATLVRFVGEIDPEQLRERLPELENAPLGSVAPWIVSTQLLGTRIEYGMDACSSVLAVYRTELRKVFGVLETLPMPEFHRVLSSSVNRTLDDALSAVLDALRAAAHLVVG